MANWKATDSFGKPKNPLKGEMLFLPEIHPPSLLTNPVAFSGKSPDPYSFFYYDGYNLFHSQVRLEYIP